MFSLTPIIERRVRDRAESYVKYGALENYWGINPGEVEKASKRYLEEKEGVLPNSTA